MPRRCRPQQQERETSAYPSPRFHHYYMGLSMKVHMRGFGRHMIPAFRKRNFEKCQSPCLKNPTPAGDPVFHSPCLTLALCRTFQYGTPRSCLCKHRNVFTCVYVTLHPCIIRYHLNRMNFCPQGETVIWTPHVYSCLLYTSPSPRD